MTGRWESVRREFRRYVAQNGGVRAVAQELHAHRATVYRIIRGDTRPSGPLRFAIERAIESRPEHPRGDS